MNLFTFLCQNICSNRVWHVIYGWKDLPVWKKMLVLYTMNRKIWQIWMPFFLISDKNINLFKTEMEEHETALCCHTHIYLSNILHIHILSSKTAQLVSYICLVIIQVSSTWKYLYYHPPQWILFVNRCVF